MRLLPIDINPALFLLPDGDEENVRDIPVIKLIPSLAVSPRALIFKRCFDVIFSLAVMIAGAPLFFMLYLVTRFTSEGPAFYRQERLGKFGKPFMMYKFRSMYVDAERSGPKLSSENDPRITKWGRVMRITRLDELPQFWNVLKGDMSLVGPRPERGHFAKKIMERDPNYRKLSQLKPGLTSIGQVVFGYAENVDEMCIRLQHDLTYLNDMSFNSDLRIILQTVRVMVQKKGK